MRVTLGSQFIGFDRHLDRLNTAKNKSQVKISTGKEVVTLADDPEKVVDVRKFDKRILQNEQYIDILDMTISELYMSTETLDTMGSLLEDIRLDAIDGINERAQTLRVIGSKMEGYLDDLIQFANSDYQGHFLFSGTKTTSNSIENINDEDGLTTPYELVREDPTQDNPSGLRVVFHGNNENRIINKSQSTDEVINATQEELFGANNEVFGLVIDLINLTRYNDDGELRGDEDVWSDDDMNKIDGIQQQMAQRIIQLNSKNGELGIKIDRLTNLRDQMADERVRLRDYKSLREDVDIAEAMIDLKRQDAALEYALQIGSRMIQTTLFDFIR